MHYLSYTNIGSEAHWKYRGRKGSSAPFKGFRVTITYKLYFKYLPLTHEYRSFRAMRGMHWSDNDVFYYIIILLYLFEIFDRLLFDENTRETALRYRADLVRNVKDSISMVLSTILYIKTKFPDHIIVVGSSTDETFLAYRGI